MKFNLIKNINLEKFLKAFVSNLKIEEIYSGSWNRPKWKNKEELRVLMYISARSSSSFDNLQANKFKNLFNDWKCNEFKRIGIDAITKNSDPLFLRDFREWLDNSTSNYSRRAYNKKEESLIFEKYINLKTKKPFYILTPKSLDKIESLFERLNLSNKESIINLVLEDYNKLQVEISKDDSIYDDSEYNVVTREKNISKELINLKNTIDKLDIKPEEKEIVSKARIGQDKLRKYLLQSLEEDEFNSIKKEELLIVSHIKPWSKSSDLEKLDPSNVILLDALVDKAFDSGLVSFDNEGRIIISKYLNDEMKGNIKLKEFFSNGKSITIDNNKNVYLKYHRENIFKDKDLYK